MSRTLKRPMFRRGGQVNDGIMTGIVDRTKKQTKKYYVLLLPMFV